MSTIVMISLAIAIIFWRPPFRLPRPSRKIVTPIIMILVVISLLLIGTFKSASNESCYNQTLKQTNCTETTARRSAL
jgi:glucan phosphoethanolaminetransferase (alkaline phosphatase superfamily)